MGLTLNIYNLKLTLDRPANKRATQKVALEIKNALEKPDEVFRDTITEFHAKYDAGNLLEFFSHRKDRRAVPAPLNRTITARTGNFR